MDVTIVDNERDREEVKRVLDGHADMSDGDITKDEWSNESKFPRKQWLMVEDEKAAQQSGYPFTVVDNREGECFVEGFSTLDGAILYLCDCHITCEDQESWDYHGAVKDRGGLDVKEYDEGKKWVIKCPIAVNGCGTFVFGYVKAIVPHGKAEEVFDENIRNAIHFNSEREANEVLARLDLPVYNRLMNTVCMQDEERGAACVSD